MNIHKKVRTVQTLNFFTSRPDVCHCPVVQTPVDIMSKNKQSTLMTHVPCETKLRSVARSVMHTCPGNWVAYECDVIYYARAAHVFSAVIKCQHCISDTNSIKESIERWDSNMNVTIWYEYKAEASVCNPTHNQNIY